ncbi:MAG: DEAD/DEAH box helicase [Sphaerochaetaceae bacterium]
MQQLEKFSALGLTDRTIDALIAKGFEEPTAIQAACIPLLLKEQVDVVGRAQTGTGKTAAFGLPILEIVEPEVQSVQALILSPTRELAVQVGAEIESLQGDRHLQILPVYGGSSMDLQIRRLRRGVHVVAGTPGRVLDHIRRGTLDLSALKFVVLDEADEILNMGFIEDVESILEQTPAEKRMLLFSATMPKPILKLAERFMHDYRLVEATQDGGTPTLTDQHFYEVREGDKIELLCRLIDIAPDFYGLVFCRTKMQSDEVCRMLIDRAYNAEAIHGDLAQKQRELILHKFREKRITILVATDVAARGIDVQDLTHVINYTIPQNPETYIHRIGRTGRAGKLGTAITFVTPSESRRFTYIRRAVKSEVVQERIPDIETVVAIKRERIINGIADSITADTYDDYSAMAQDLIEIHEPKAIVAALLERHYGSQLNERAYKHITQAEDRGRNRREQGAPRERDDRYARRDDWDRRRDDYNDGRRPGASDEVRLFIAKGRSSGMTKRLLVDYIKEHAQVTDREIDGVQVMEDFSFVTAPVEAAQLILQSFSFMENDGKPIVTKARPDNPNGKHLAGRHRSDRNDRYDRPSDGRRESYRDSASPRPARDDRGYSRDDRHERPERPEQFDRRDRYSYPTDRQVPSYAKKGSKSRYKSGGFKKSPYKGR